MMAIPKSGVRMIRSALLPVMASGILAGCQVVPSSEPAPRPAMPPPAAAPAPTSPVPPPVAWDVAPVAEGNWSYRADSLGSTATFGAGEQPAPLSFRCETAQRRIVITRAGGGSGGALPVTIRTSSGVLNWPSVVAAPSAALVARTITRPASDPGFDWIAYSRGRFSIEVPGERPLIVPAWAEVARVVEDCRG